MLVRLLPEQISNYWDLLKPAILDALPPITSKRLGFENKLLQNILMGGMQCWLSMDKEGKVSAVLTTTITHEDCSGTKNLLLYSLTSMDGTIADEEWAEGLSTMVKFAQGNGCESIIAYTSSDVIEGKAVQYGWETDVKIVTIRLEDK